MAEVLADSTAVAELQKCTSVSELETCLNKKGADCTREEALRFLRAWEDAAADNENADMDDAKPADGFFNYIRARFGHGARKRRGTSRTTVTIEQIENRMSKYI